MIVKNLFNDVLLIKNDIYEDKRGYFSETYNEKVFKKNGLSNHFLQDNLSFSKHPGTIRGLHFQNSPFSQGKLLRVINGSIEDFFVDLRRSSPTYEKFSSIKLSYETGSIYIPGGFAHGFCTLEKDTIVMYKVDKIYSKNHEVGIRWDDSFFKIKWPLKNNNPIISEKDENLPSWNSIKDKLDL
tara:strand:+ start:2487 stop:3038 length:552 start_codon:yes stop_codon:yes gene_type:complete